MKKLQNSKNTTVKDVKIQLHKALKNIPNFHSCALLDYPSHYNVGDHLIWLGNLFYITHERKAKIDYVADRRSFSDDDLLKHSKDGPILLHGGGNFGDIWPRHHEFRERIVDKYRNRQIIVLPQTVYFSDENKLKESAKIFNRHPDVTIFARDSVSYEILSKAFWKCSIFKAPDMAFQLTEVCKRKLTKPHRGRIVYMSRTDHEIDNRFNPEKPDFEGVEVDDWSSFKWIRKTPENWVYFPGRVRLIRDGWQKGIKTPKEWLSRQNWMWLHPCSVYLDNVYKPHLQRASWELMHSGMYQLQSYELVITNRLHVHILCLMLDIPHIVLPGSYYKISSFCSEWTSDILGHKLLEKPMNIPEALEDLKQEFCFSG